MLVLSDHNESHSLVIFIDCGHLVLLFNAATTNPAILKMLPKYTFKHYTYLRDEYLNCFPEPSVSHEDVYVLS